MTFDVYDQLLERLGFNYTGVGADKIEVNEFQVRVLSVQLGIYLYRNHSLYLFNDNQNGMMHVILALMDIVDIDFDNAKEIMLEAHNNGKALIKVGHFKDLESIMDQLIAKDLQCRLINNRNEKNL